MTRKIFFVLLLFAIVACRSDEPLPIPKIFVVSQGTEKRPFLQDIVDQDNCNGKIETSQTVTRSHTILYTLDLGAGVKVDADGSATLPAIGEIGLGAEVAASYNVGYGHSDNITRSQTVSAARETHAQYDIQQFEIWENGEIIIVAGEINQRIPYSFRRDFSIDVVALPDIPCPPTSASQPSQATASNDEPIAPTSTATPVSTNTPRPTATPRPAATPRPTFTPRPTATPIVDTPPGSVLGMRDFWRQNGMRMQVKDFALLDIHCGDGWNTWDVWGEWVVILKNETSSDLVTQITPENFFLQDEQGLRVEFRIEETDRDPGCVSHVGGGVDIRLIRAGQEVRMVAQGAGKIGSNNLYHFGVDEAARIQNAVWQIDISR